MIPLSLAAAATIVVAAAPSAAHAATSGGTTVVSVRTLPSVPGATFVVGGRRYVTDGAGQVRLPLRPDVPVAQQVNVRDTQLAPDVRTRFGRWYGRVPSNNLVATMAFHYRIRVALHGPPGADLDPAAIVVRLKSSTGEAIRLQGEEITRPFWVQGSRVVALTGGLESKELVYSAAGVQVHGADVVNRGEQRFVPAATRVFDIQTLFYAARFSAKDMIFGFSIGSAVILTYPDGTKLRVPFGSGSRAILPALPRGNYTVEVDAPGMSFVRPLALSKAQDVDLEVLSYLDVALFVVVLGGGAIGLLLFGRGRSWIGRIQLVWRRMRLVILAKWEGL